MKKLCLYLLIFSIGLAASLMLSACTQTTAPTTSTSEKETTTEETTTEETTTVETSTESSQNGTETEPVIEVPKEASDLIDQIYEKAKDVIDPEALMLTAVDLNDREAVKYQTGLDDTKGLISIVVSSPLMNVHPYSLVYVKADESVNINELQDAMLKGADLSKWICVLAEKAASITLDHSVLLVMGSQQEVEAVLNAAKAVGAEQFDQVGEIKEK